MHGDMRSSNIYFKPVALRLINQHCLHFLLIHEIAPSILSNVFSKFQPYLLVVIDDVVNPIPEVLYPGINCWINFISACAAISPAGDSVNMVPTIFFFTN